MASFLVYGPVVPPVAVGDDVRGAICYVEIVEGNERVAEEVRVRPGDRPEAVVLVQDLPLLSGKHVEERRDVDLAVLAYHAFDQRPDPRIEEQVVHGAGLREQVVRAPGPAGGTEAERPGDGHFGVEDMAQARDFGLRDEVRNDRVATVLDLGDPFGDVEAVDDDVTGFLD